MAKIMTIKDRILTFARDNGLKMADFCEMTGISLSNFKGVAMKSDLGGDKIVKILTCFPSLSAEWLVMGVGKMAKEDNILTDKIDSLPVINQSYKGSPYYNVDFIGGFDLLMNDQTINPDFYINYPPYNKDGVVWVNLTGRSMEPELSNGDIIALKPMNTPIQYLPTKEIYAIVTEEWRTVKRIELSDRDGFIRLLPSNPEYKGQEIPISMITRVYAVLGSIRKFF